MSRQPLVFLPGLLCDGRLWRDQALALSDIAEPFIADLTRDDSIAGMARRVLDMAPARFALSALSMGGYVAFEILRQAPGRVSRLALLDTSAAVDDAARAARRRAGIGSLQLGRFAGVTDRLLPQLIHASRVGGPVGDELKAMAARVGGEAFLRQQQAILGRADARPLLPDIRVPTLVAVGDGDVLTPPADALEIHRAIPASRFHVFRNCGHLPALELPEETADVLRAWLLP
ncbi:alpha/beta fold hydrolase [Paracidovorax anthurii]|uniref:Pimeloyl-ACP methyl ester carboxylesterase n=1 Tax=Paracidovorax anthurii TaxID=78229 RepID=A0A328YS60_9BURK|nr:alpha/beta fold hydrolase [Paracidovorax anthurii]RAR72946.1 pimeloyl-ACP methyl ester carboxylesterase [Paracidovorax anthurii]